jgi:hypothetical protein
MIVLTRCDWDGRQWVIRAAVDEGVYHRTAYPVTLTYLGPIPAGARHDEIKLALERVLLNVLKVHLKKGSLPPGGLLVNWRNLLDHRFSGDGLEAVSDLAAFVDGEVATVAQGEGHGYFHPFARTRTDAPRT